MTEIYETTIHYQQFYELCRKQGISLDPEPGDRMLYQGQAFIVAAVEGDRLALVNDLTGVGLESSEVIAVQEWRDEMSCLLLPRIEQILELIKKQTSLYPMMTPGVKETKSVWQVSHPNSPPVVSSSLAMGLLALAIQILTNRE